MLPLAGAAVLAGCGFRPVYMKTASDKPGPAARNLAAIEVGIIPDRPGQLLRQALQQNLGSDSGTLARYKLAVGFSISGEGIAVEQDSVATRVRFIAHANWTLTSLDPPTRQITSGAARAFDAMDVLDQQYFAADLQTEAIQRRLAGEIANEIAMELAVYFRRQAGAG